MHGHCAVQYSLYRKDTFVSRLTYFKAKDIPLLCWQNLGSSTSSSYLVFVLTELTGDHPINRLDELLPLELHRQTENTAYVLAA
jgi:hypothetical protein